MGLFPVDALHVDLLIIDMVEYQFSCNLITTWTARHINTPVQVDPQDSQVQIHTSDFHRLLARAGMQFYLVAHRTFGHLNRIDIWNERREDVKVLRSKAFSHRQNTSSADFDSSKYGPQPASFNVPCAD